MNKYNKNNAFTYPGEKRDSGMEDACEHLNRAIIIEKTAAKEYRLPMVNVVPKLKAGGSFATAVYAALQAPVAVEAIHYR